MYYFVPNLKPYTYHRGKGNKRFDCYLLSTDYLEDQKVVLKELQGNRERLVADNGNFDLIKGLIKDNVTEAEKVSVARKHQERKQGRYVRPGELDNAILTSYRSLAENLSERSRALSSESYIRRLISKQSAMRPAYVIGMEDFTIPLLTGLGIEPQYLDFPLHWYAEHISIALEFALKTQAHYYGDISASVFAGLHALDFDTAYQAGQLAGQAGVRAVATGLGSALTDRSWVDYRVASGTVIPFAAPVPRAYVRVMEIICGLSLGYAENTGKRLAIHVLGIGTPILVALIGLLGAENTFIATDSTAPIKDAYSSKTISLYVDTPAPRKLKAHKIIDYWLREDMAWQCPCPYCRKVNQTNPPQLDAARSWWEKAGRPAITSADLYGAHPLTRFFSFLSNPADNSLRAAIGLARIGHNHWILQRLEKHARDYEKDIVDRCYRVGLLVKSYLLAPGGSAGWDRAVSIAWEMTRETALKIDRYEQGFHL